MDYSINLGCWNNIFAVPRSVVNEHIKLAKEDYIKVLLVILASAGEKISRKKISEISAVAEENIDDAISFWQERNIIKNSCNEITPVQTSKTSEIPSKNTTDISDNKNNIINSVIAADKSVSTISVSDNIKIKTNDALQLSSFEVSERINCTEELKWIVSETERMFGRLLNKTESAVIVSMFDYAGIPADIIVMIIEYCVSIEKSNMRFIEKTAYSWMDSGINTHQKVEAHITNLVTSRNNESLIKSAFGIWDRNLTTKQKEFIPVWLDEWKFTIEMIKIAYEKCIDNTGKLSFPYINKILSSWNEKGISTPEDVENNENARRQEEALSSTFRAEDFDDFSNYTVPDLSKKNSKRTRGNT